MRSNPAISLLIPFLLMTACRQTAPVTTTPGITPSPSPAFTGTCESVEGGTEGAFVHFTGATTEQEATFETITFEFSPGDQGPQAVPRFQIDAVTPPLTEDPSGEPMEVNGSHFARVIFHGASGVEFIGDTYRETYTGPKELEPGFDVLVEAEEQGDFEATLSWVMGLSRNSCWSADELEDPLRLQIRFAR